MLCLTASTVLIAVNWYTYIYSVAQHRVLESSLGYFLTPLVNVLLGMIFLGERIKPLQMFSLGLASIGLIVFAMSGNDLIPWLPLVLAFSFAFYGLLRKTVDANATTGLFVETLLLAPIAVGLLFTRQVHGIAKSISVDTTTWIKLMLSGIITTIPLLLFAEAARRLRLSTLGFLQYLSPSLQFLVAVLVFREPFTSMQLVSFALIWIAVAIYSLDSLLAYHTGRELAEELAADPRSKM
jgi:chloramphenicol-sensitive protein RarD